MKKTVKENKANDMKYMRGVEKGKNYGKIREKREGKSWRKWGRKYRNYRRR
jgi:hypothetical protein